MLVDTVGRPLPPSGIAERLQQVHPHLGLRWYRKPGAGTGHWWAIVYTWEPADPRWAWVQQGQCAPTDTVDVVAFLPDDCSAEQAYGFLVNGVRHGATVDIRKVLERVQSYNATANAEVVDTVLADVADGIAKDLGHFAGKKEQTSYGGLPAKPRKKKG